MHVIVCQSNGPIHSSSHVDSRIAQRHLHQSKLQLIFSVQVYVLGRPISPQIRGNAIRSMYDVPNILSEAMGTRLKQSLYVPGME